MSRPKEFPWRSPLSVRPPGHAVPRLDQLAEVEAELARRNSPAGYPALIAKSSLTAEDAAGHIAILAAIRDDLLAETFCARWHLAAHMQLTLPAEPVRGGPDFPWEVKLREIRRELAIKRNALPKKVANPTNPMNEADARRILECWDALHWLHFAYLSGFPQGPARLALIATREADRARGPDWHDAAGEHGSGDPGIEWAGIARLATAMGQGRPWTDIVTGSTLQRYARLAGVRTAEASEASERTRAGTVERALAEPRLLVFELRQWLNSIASQYHGPASAADARPEEIAA